MASQLALKVSQRHFETTVTIGAQRLADNVDAELAPVREIVELLAHPKFTTDEQGNIRYYVTKSDVEAARSLWASIQVKE